MRFPKDTCKINRVDDMIFWISGDAPVGTNACLERAEQWEFAGHRSITSARDAMQSSSPGRSVRTARDAWRFRGQQSNWSLTGLCGLVNSTTKRRHGAGEQRKTSQSRGKRHHKPRRNPGEAEVVFFSRKSRAEETRWRGSTSESWTVASDAQEGLCSVFQRLYARDPKGD